MHAHNVYNLNSYNNDDSDGEKLKSLRKQLFNYAIDHIKKYKLIYLQINDLKRKIVLSDIDIEKYENHIKKFKK